MVKKWVNDFTVVANIPLNESNYLIRLRAPELLPEISSGQFVNIDIERSKEVFLRRPFSVFEVDYETNILSIIVKILGRGSGKLTEALPGEKLSLIYPLGHGFTLPGSEDKVLLVGGGSGVAPMLFLARRSGLPSQKVDIILGARSREDHLFFEDYKAFGRLHYTSEDGSVGVRGLVTHHPLLQENLSGYNRVYTCGPEPMMKAVASLAAKASVICEVSLENMMACGFGVCLCCIEPTVHGNACVCTEGPVFNMNELKWQI